MFAAETFQYDDYDVSETELQRILRFDLRSMVGRVDRIELFGAEELRVDNRMVSQCPQQAERITQNEVGL